MLGQTNLDEDPECEGCAHAQKGGTPATKHQAYFMRMRKRFGVAVCSLSCDF